MDSHHIWTGQKNTRLIRLSDRINEHRLKAGVYERQEADAGTCFICGKPALYRSHSRVTGEHRGGCREHIRAIRLDLGQQEY